MIVVDTNCIIRFVTRDLEKEAKLVKELFESDELLLIPDVVFPEVEYVLTGDYSFPREKQMQIFTFLISLPNATISSEIKAAVRIFEKSTLDMADCVVAAYSRNGKLASFDKELLKKSGAKKYFV